MEDLYASPPTSDDEQSVPPLLPPSNTATPIAPLPSVTPTTNNIEKEEEETCVICLDPMIPSSIPITLPCKHRGHYNCLMGVVNKLCPLCRHPIPKHLYKKVEIDYDPLQGHERWLWGSRDGATWYYYLAEHDKLLEEGYQTYLLACSRDPQETRKNNEVKLLVRGSTYTINFVTMEQRAPSGVVRRVKRLRQYEEPEGIRGFAGAVPKE